MKKACHAVRKSLQEAYFGLDGSKWTDETIKYFNIHFQKCSFNDMFSEAEQNSNVGEVGQIFDALEKGFTPVIAESKFGVRFDYSSATRETVDFWAYLEALANHPPSIRTYTVAFIHELLRLTLQSAPDFAVFSNPKWQLLFCGDRHKVQPSFIVTDKHVHAIIHIESTNDTENHPFTQIVAEAFTAYQLALEESCYSGKTPESIDKFDLLLAVCSETVISFLRVQIPLSALRHIQAGKKLKEPLVFHQLEENKKDSFNFLLIDHFRTILSILKCWRKVLNMKIEQQPTLTA
jgi:hypothetical protein